MKNGEATLKRNALTLQNLIMIAVGGMVGSAIFSLSGQTYALAGPAAILTWVIGAGVVLVYALNLAELASYYPRAGGTFVFPSAVLGKTPKQKTLIGWIAAWGRLWDVLIAISFTALFVAQYLSGLIPGAENYQVAIALVTIVIIWLLNALDIQLMGKVNTILVVFLTVMCAVFIGVGVGYINPQNFVPFFGQGQRGFSGFLGAIPIAMLGYGSIIAVACAAEEVENPRRNIPKAIFYGMLIVVVMYVLMLIATYGLVPWQEFVDNNWALFAPQQYVISRALPQFPWLSPLISFSALIALFTTMLVCCMDAGRTIMAISKAGVLPSIFGEINPKTHTPVAGLTIACCISAVLSLFPQFAMDIVSSGAMTSAITILIIAITVIANRKKAGRPDGVYITPGGYFVPIATMAIIAVVITQLESTAYLITAVSYAIALCIYAAAYSFNRQNFAVPSTDELIKDVF